MSVLSDPLKYPRETDYYRLAAPHLDFTVEAGKAVLFGGCSRSI
jgi:hypothetical protein